MIKHLASKLTLFPVTAQRLTCESGSCSGATVECTTAKWLSPTIWKGRTRLSWSCWCSVGLRFNRSIETQQPDCDWLLSLFGFSPAKVRPVCQWRSFLLWIPLCLYSSVHGDGQVIFASAWFSQLPTLQGWLELVQTVCLAQFQAPDSIWCCLIIKQGSSCYNWTCQCQRSDSPVSASDARFHLAHAGRKTVEVTVDKERDVVSWVPWQLAFPGKTRAC